jgi:3-hydroxyisobutyrate dehydrogenase
MTSIGLMGAGVMGLSAAQRFISAGHSLWVFDPNPTAQDRARDLGAQVVSLPAEAARQAEIILMYLPGPKEVWACVAGQEGLLTTARPGSIIVDQSTVDPGGTQRLSAMARKQSVGYLDAPVLGRPSAVGRWALPVGGESVDLDICRPILELVADKIFPVGPSGSGNKVKLLNQLMFGAINAMTAEMMAIADSLGIPPRLLFEIITSSEAATVSNLFKELGARIAQERYDEPTFSVDLLIKDVRLAVDMAKGHQAPPLLSRTVEFINEMAQAQGYGGFDTAIMWKCYRKIWG